MGLNVYQSGMRDAWETARKIVYGGGLCYEALVKIFGTADLERIFTENTASEANEKIRKYEASKFRKGDIVKQKAGEEVGVITKISVEHNQCVVMLKNGDYNIWILNGMVRMGHTDMIKTITDLLEGVPIHINLEEAECIIRDIK